MDRLLKAPEIKRYIDFLGRINYREVHCNFSYDDLTYQLLDQLFALTKCIAPNDENGYRQIWIKAERGTPEEFGNYEEMLEEELVEDYDEFLAWWKSEFPDETEWYNLTLVDDSVIPYRAVFLNHKFVIEDDPSKERGYPNDISEFAKWILASVENVIEQLKAGIYNATIQRELPDAHRTGTLQRKQLWEIWPDTKSDFFSNLSPQECREFINYAKDELDPFVSRLKEVTANQFYHWCSLGYHANQYSGTELSFRQQYFEYADGRDENLGKIDPDSSEAFDNWFHHRSKIGHPWEVCRGGSSTHISLYVQEDTEGYSLRLAGSSQCRTVETIKFFLALHHAGLPVTVHEADTLKERILGNEKIGVVPAGVFPRYCYSFFPDEKIIDFMNLPSEDRDKFSSVIQWKPIPTVSLQK